MEYVEVFVKNDQLEIKIRKGVNIQGNSTLKVAVNTAQKISTISAEGAAKIKLNDTLIGDDIDVSVSGASIFTGDIKSSHLNVYAEGGSQADITGSTSSIYINASGACSVGSFELSVIDSDLKLEGASDATLTIDGKIRFSAKGACTLTYKGQAIVDHLDLSGGSKIVNAN